MQFPHCDARILHHHGACVYCDAHPDWQQLRVTWGINFTGESEPGVQPCPADRARGDGHMAWGGNVARDQEGNPVIPPPHPADVQAAATTVLNVLKESDD